MSEAKIRLSPKEMELVTTTHWILTKNALLQKIHQLLAGLQVKQQLVVDKYPGTLPSAVMNTTMKISKGENYKGLPYLLLDYPRYFERENIFAIRTMFWWGNFFSVTVHLSGQYKKKAEDKIINRYPFFKEKEFFVCINDDPWEHHFEANNYVSFSEWNKNDVEKCIREKSFIKIANKINLQPWEPIEETLLTCFIQLVEGMAD